MLTRNLVRHGLWIVFCVAAILRSPAQTPITLELDARETPRRILHARLTLPASAGPLTLVYPKWIPGEHGPTGPITDLVALQARVGQQRVPWRRDPEDLYAFHLDLPAATESLEVAFDFILPPSGDGFSSAGSSSAHLLVLSWNQVVLYPRGAKARDLKIKPQLQLPAHWEFGSALPVAQRSGERIEFQTVSLETLVDSPLLAARYFRTVPLASDVQPPHQIHVGADSAAALEMRPEEIQGFNRLIRETGELFGARHYPSYHFLLTLSDHVAHFGLEHHASSDNRTPERMLLEEDLRLLWAGLLPHEVVHSWNGKYRRPADIATPDYQQPMRTELLWVYEGLTTYLGEMLTARSGLWTRTNFHQALALAAAHLDYQKGRQWRPLADTAIAAQLLYEAAPGGMMWRRSVDFYPEGWLIWQEADVIIRQQSQGRRSLDDFCRRFFGGESGPPRVVPYTYDEVLAALQEVQAFDWRSFFDARVYQVNPRAPMGGIEGAGWRLVYKATLPDLLRASEGAKKMTDLSFSLGFAVKEDGGIVDVVPESVAAQAGLGPHMKLVAVQGRRWNPTLLRAAVQQAQRSREPIELLIENSDYFRTVRLSYFDGERYPHLERDPNKPDLLGEILKPRAAH